MNVERIDNLIQQGQAAKAWSLVKDLQPHLVERESLAVVARFGVRLGEPIFTLKMLGKVVREHREGIASANFQELLNYYEGLIRMGLFEEAKLELEAIDQKKNPEVYGLLGSSQISQWNYRAAVDSYRHYLKGLDQDHYHYLVGSLNLAASLIATDQYFEAKPYLRELIRQARQRKLPLLLGNCYELQAQNNIGLGKYEAARASIEKSQRYLGRSGSVWAHYAKKWKLHIDLKLKGPKQQLREQGEVLLAESIQSGYAESRREIERLLSEAWKDKYLFLRAYFSSRNRYYRERLEKVAWSGLEFPETYVWTTHEGCSEAPVLPLNLHKHAMSGRLLQCLFHDMYRPISIGHIFSSLHSGEYFDPFHSPDRIYGTLKGLRKLIAEVPEYSGLQVSMKNGAMKVYFESPRVIELSRRPSTSKPQESDKVRASGIKRKFNSGWFKSSEVAKEFQISSRTAGRWIVEVKKIYKLEETGLGRAKRYRFKNSA